MVNDEKIAEDETLARGGQHCLGINRAGPVKFENAEWSVIDVRIAVDPFIERMLIVRGYYGVEF